MKPWIAGMLGMLLCLPVSAEVYRWVDSEGNVHFGDRPPGNRAEEVRIRNAGSNAPAPVSATERLEKQRRLLNAYQEERLQKEEAARRQQARQKDMQQRCNQARDQLRQYEGRRIYRLDKDGNRVFMDEGERTRHINELKANIRKHC